MGMLMMASSITGSSPTDLFWQVGANQIPAPIQGEVVEIREVLTKSNPKEFINKTITVEEYVKNYFSDIPVLVEVAKCESRFRQHDKYGNILRGEENRLDIGVMQINRYYHNTDSDKLGYNIDTIEGNTAYARHLYEKSGLKPWKSSSRCWSKSTAYAEYKDLAMK